MSLVGDRDLLAAAFGGDSDEEEGAQLDSSVLAQLAEEASAAEGHGRQKVLALEAAAWQRGSWHPQADAVRVAAASHAETWRCGDLRVWSRANAAGRRRRLSRCRPVPQAVAERIRNAALGAIAAPAPPPALTAAQAEVIGRPMIERLWRAKHGDVADELAANLSFPAAVARVEVIAEAARQVGAAAHSAGPGRVLDGVAALLRALWAADCEGVGRLLGHNTVPSDGGISVPWHDRVPAPNDPAPRDAAAAAVAAFSDGTAPLDAASGLQRWVKSICLLAALDRAPDSDSGEEGDGPLTRPFAEEVLREAVQCAGRLLLVAACAEPPYGIKPEVLDMGERWGCASAPGEHEPGGVSAAHFAAASGCPAKVAAAILLGSPLDGRTRGGGATPTHYAASQGGAAVLACLSAGGAPLDALDDQGRSPLHWAAAEGNLECVRLLRDSGCPAAARDQEGQDCVSAARLRGDFPLAGLLASVLQEPLFVSAPGRTERGQ